LFLVRPLLLLGPRAPLWLIPLGGAVLVAVSIRVANIEELQGSAWLFAPIGFSLVLVIFGVVLVIRRWQVFRHVASRT
jgi:hypothetical protein